MLKLMKNLTDAALGKKDATMGYEQVINDRIQAYLQANFQGLAGNGKRFKPGAITKMRVALQMSLQALFLLALERVDMASNASVWVVNPYPISLLDEKWPWLRELPIATEGQYHGLLLHLRNASAALAEATHGTSAPTVVIIAVPNTASIDVKIACQKFYKEYENGDVLFDVALLRM